MQRDRSYHDLSPEEKKTYDDLRARQKAEHDKHERKKLKIAADAMLGLRKEEEHIPDPIVREAGYKVWRGSSSRPAPRAN